MGAALVSALLVSEVAHERADLRVHALSRLEERVRPAAARHGLLHEPVALRRALEEPPSPNAIAPAQPLQLARVIVCLRPLSLQRAVERCRRRRRRGASRLSLLRLLEQPASPASLSALSLLSHLRPLCRRRGWLAACRGGRGGGGRSCEQGHLGHERRQRREVDRVGDSPHPGSREGAAAKAERVSLDEDARRSVGRQPARVDEGDRARGVGATQVDHALVAVVAHHAVLARDAVCVGGAKEHAVGRLAGLQPANLEPRAMLAQQGERGRRLGSIADEGESSSRRALLCPLGCLPSSSIKRGLRGVVCEIGVHGTIFLQPSARARDH